MGSDNHTENWSSFDELIGRVLGTVRILERVGRGGMGTVFRGEHLILAKPVAISTGLSRRIVRS